MKKIKKIKIRVNGKVKTVVDKISLFKLTNNLKIPLKKVAIELNQKIVNKKKAEIWCLSVATIFSGYLAFYFMKMTYISIQFEERSEGADEILIWIPQSTVALGSVFFFICVAHHLISLMLGKKIK